MLTEQALPPRSARVLVFIPCFNDARKLAELTRSVEAQGERYSSLVIDDGSYEPVRPEALSPRSLCVRLPANFGLGVATHVAFGHALRHGYGVVARVDADGQHDVGDVVRLVREIEEGGADIAIAQRLNQDKGARARRLAKAYYRMLARFVTFGRAPLDMNSGLFALTARAIERLNRMTFERFPEPEMFVAAIRAGMSVRCIDVRQNPREHGRSKLGPVQGVQMLFRFHLFIVTELLRRRP